MNTSKTATIQESPQLHGELPLVTIGMPTYNREWSLAKVLDAVLNFDYDRRRIRLCFVDNVSKDKTLRMVDEFKSKHENEFESITVDVLRSNIPKARNVCFERATGTDYIFFLDSDIVAPPDCLKRLLGHFNGDSSLGIASLPWDNKNARKRAGVLYDAFQKPEGAGYAYKVGNGCNLVSMKVYNQIGGFNERLRVHEDGEFCYRARRAGFRIICDFSSEALHLRDIQVNSKFYLSFVNDSAETYTELLKDGSAMIVAKYVSSFLLLAAVVALVLLRNFDSFLLFLTVVIISIFINTSRRVLDDGIHVRARYIPVIGVLFTGATVMITGLSILRLLGMNWGRK